MWYITYYDSINKKWFKFYTFESHKKYKDAVTFAENYSRDTDYFIGVHYGKNEDELEELPRSIFLQGNVWQEIS